MLVTKNPYKNALALENSCYTQFDGNQLVYTKNNVKVSTKINYIHSRFRSLILSKSFTCVLGKAAIKKNNYRFGLYKDMDAEATLRGISFDLYHFVCEQPILQSEYTTFVATFENPIIRDEKHFELLAWDFLRNLSSLDENFHNVDIAVHPDPNHPEYSYSFAEKAFFIVGLHPASSRFTRRFTWPTLIFNAHSQFENLRVEGKFENFQKLIRNRDIHLQGSTNPNLANFGETPEARQYTGRHVEKNWICPHLSR